LDHFITLLNIYGPYEGKEVFGEGLFTLNCIFTNKFVIGGYLNFILRKEETWGTSTYEDKFEKNFIDQIELGGLLDVQPIQICPTWRNNQSGVDGVSKRLDHFLSHHIFLRYMEFIVLELVRFISLIISHFVWNWTNQMGNSVLLLNTIPLGLKWRNFGISFVTIGNPSRKT
jgi:hypothetical protein